MTLEIKHNWNLLTFRIGCEKKNRLVEMVHSQIRNGVIEYQVFNADGCLIGDNDFGFKYNSDISSTSFLLKYEIFKVFNL